MIHMFINVYILYTCINKSAIQKKYTIDKSQLCSLYFHEDSNMPYFMFFMLKNTVDTQETTLYQGCTV